jgi:cytochrome b pre-mRNA-processing protein 3
MHIWFLHKRLILDKADQSLALAIQEELFNILWDDTTCRIRQAGVQELLVNRNLAQVQQYTFLHLTHYDHAYTEFLDQPAERMDELRKLVWTHILCRDEEAVDRYDQIDRIAWYIEANYQNIVHHLPQEYFREARLQWTDLPDFSNMRDASGALMPDNPVLDEDMVPAPWRKNITNMGEDYWWNPETMKTTYLKPTGPDGGVNLGEREPESDHLKRKQNLMFNNPKQK